MCRSIQLAYIKFVYVFGDDDDSNAGFLLLNELHGIRVDAFKMFAFGIFSWTLCAFKYFKTLGDAKMFDGNLKKKKKKKIS